MDWSVMKRYIFHLRFLLTTLAAGFLLGCPGGPTTPTITLKATDCEKDKIAIEASKTVSGSASNWTVSVNITIKCDGQPLGNAEIKYSPWIGDPIKLETNQEGKARSRRRVSTTARPGNLNIEVEIEGFIKVRSGLVVKEIPVKNSAAIKVRNKIPWSRGK